MSRRNKLPASAVLGAALLLGVFGSCGAVQLAATPVTPPGIKIADLAKGPVFVTDGGMTIYKFLPAVGTWGHAKRQVEVVNECIYQCPTEYPPVKAPADAKPVGDFTIVTRPDGSRQWAYKNVPLETFVYDKQPGDVLGEGTYPFNGPRVPAGEAAWLESDAAPEKPPAPPLPSADIPVGVKVQAGIAGSRYFANASGLTLYTMDADAKAGSCAGACLIDWQPLPAGQVAHAIGDWSVVTSPDGMRQWAYKGAPVYTYAKESTAGEMAGEGIGGRWHALIEYRSPLPAEVATHITESGPVFADKATGKTLYYRGLAHRPYDYLGFNHPGYFFGTVNCYNECAKTFPPLLAPPGAKPIGEWWLVTRVDGAKQWAYRGLPVYTYAPDEPGRHMAADLDVTWTFALANNRVETQQ